MNRTSAHTEQPIPIVIDDRETGGALVEELRRMPEFDPCATRLTTGDYLVDKHLLFERKTLTDLMVSIQTGRLFSQALRLTQQQNRRPALLLEGSSRDLGGGGMSREAIQGALITVSLFIGIPVLRSRSARESARTMLYAARQYRDIAYGTLPRRGLRQKGKPALQNQLLQGLPGVGPRRAARLLKRFGSVESVLCADADALAEIEGIGQRIAQRIRWMVSEPHAVYAANASGAQTPDELSRGSGSACGLNDLQGH